ncbi:MAG: metal-dependent hydrolase [Akkermansiaceae bacterium]
MDSLTQATLGAAVGEAVLGKKLGNRGMLWGLLFGTLPDLDIIFNPLLDTARELEFHRGASHSIAIMLLATAFLAKPLAKMWRKEKVTPVRAGLFIFITWSTHVLIDCFTVYGTTIFWPVSDYRAAFNNLFIIDPLYTLPLVISLLWLAFYRSKKQQKTRTKILTWGVAISTIYVGITFALKSYASSSFEADLARRDVSYERRFEAPSVFNTLLWRSVVDRGDEFWVGYRSVFDRPSEPIRWTIYPKQQEAITPFEGEREVETLKWFSQGYWIARPHKEGVWIADLRFGETRIYDAKPGMVDSRFMFSWSFLSEAEGDRLRQSVRKVDDPKDSLRRIGLRIVGNTETWEANPRLAGIRGNLPEFLRVVE